MTGQQPETQGQAALVRELQAMPTAVVNIAAKHALDLLCDLPEHADDWALLDLQVRFGRAILAAPRAEAHVPTVQAEDLDDIARDLFSELCEGDGQHSEELDRALILKHLRRASVAPSQLALRDDTACEACVTKAVEHLASFASAPVDPAPVAGEPKASHRVSSNCGAECPPCEDAKALARDLATALAQVERLTAENKMLWSVRARGCSCVCHDDYEAARALVQTQEPTKP